MLTFLAGVLSWAADQTGLLSHLPSAVQHAAGAVGAVLTILGIRKVSAPDALTQLLDKTGSGWKTVAGVIGTLLGTVLAPDVLNLLPAGIAHVLTTVGGVLAALGLYHAQVLPLEGAVRGR